MRVMRREIERADVADAPVVSEGGLSPSTLVSRPAELHHQPLAEPSVRTLASLGSHQANPPVMPSRQCTKRSGRVRASFSTKPAARTLCPL